MTETKVKARKVDNMRRIADGLTNPKDAALVRDYANELAAAGKAARSLSSSITSRRSRHDNSRTAVHPVPHPHHLATAGQN